MDKTNNMDFFCNYYFSCNYYFIRYLLFTTPSSSPACKPWIKIKIQLILLACAHLNPVLLGTGTELSFFYSKKSHGLRKMSDLFNLLVMVYEK